MGTGKQVAAALREAGLKVETHGTWFRHDTPDDIWLTVVGYFGWVVLKRDKKIGRSLIELDALLDAEVKSFVMASGQLKDIENASIFIEALPKIFHMIDANDFPFIAKVFRDGTVELSKTKPKFRKGIQKRKRHPNEAEIQRAIRRISALRETG